MKRVTINVDASLTNADWTKGEWDLLGVTNITELRAYLEREKITPAAFKRRPVYTLNVGKMPWLKKL